MGTLTAHRLLAKNFLFRGRFRRDVVGWVSRASVVETNIDVAEYHEKGVVCLYTLPWRFVMVRPPILIVLSVLLGACRSEPANVAVSPAPIPVSEGPCATTPALFLVDGARVDKEVFDSLGADQIETINVFLAPTAVPRFGPEASCGAIVVTTQ